MAGVVAISISACSTTMHVVEKSLEEGNLVPEQAVATADFLNEYHHQLPVPRDQLLDIDIALERPNAMVSGDTVYAQIGLATKKPIAKKTQYHFLVYNPAKLTGGSQQVMQNAARDIQSLANTLPDGSRLTLDFATAVPDFPLQADSLLPAKDETELVDFLRRYVRTPLEPGRHHFVLLLSDHGDLSFKQKQDLVDLANLYKVYSMTLSVLALGDSPQVAFLRSLSSKGEGRFSVTTETFNTESWFKEELRYANAQKLRNIKLTIKGLYGATMKTVTSSMDYQTSEDTVKKSIPEMIQGKNYVMLLKFKTPKVDLPLTAELFTLDVDYFDPVENQYHTISKIGKIHYVMDRNNTLNNDNQKVARSLLIMGTQSVIQDIVPVIRDQRYYQAVAMLTKQKLKLQRYAQKNNDKELLRDAQILNKYADKLFNYDQEMFQTVKIWHDLSWDTDRYAEDYQ